MGDALIQQSESAFPRELGLVLGDPPLIRGESREQYDGLLAVIAKSIPARSAIDWIFVRDVADISWQILRERRIEIAIIKNAQRDIVLETLKSTLDGLDVIEDSRYRIFSAHDDADRWANDPEGREEIDSRLAEHGVSSEAILAKAYVRAARDLEFIQNRIAFYERRRIALLREIGRRDEALARNLGVASEEVIDAEFSEAAE